MADIYDIVTQAPTTDIGAAGTVVQAIEITFRTKPSSLTGRVKVPVAIFSEREVDQAVRAQAHVMEAVQAL